MPITPRFTLSQTPTHITLQLHLPHVRVSSSTIELIVDGYDLHFHSTPYLLHLSFPERILDDAEIGREARAVYDPDDRNGTLTVTIWKEEEALWKDLDLLGQLVCTSDPKAAGVGAFGAGGAINGAGDGGRDGGERGGKISVLSSTVTDTDTVDDENNDGAVDSIQTSPTTSSNITSSLLDLAKPRYGFLNMHHSVFSDLSRAGAVHETLELPDPDTTQEDQRRIQRLDKEQDDFDSDRYLGDLDIGDGEDGVYEEAMLMVPHWQSTMHAVETETNTTSTEMDDVVRTLDGLTVTTTSTSSPPPPSSSSTTTSQPTSTPPAPAQHQQLTPEEQNILHTLKPRPPLPPPTTIPPHAQSSLLLHLLDILYAYIYDHRTTNGEPTVESSRTIVILSPTLSWLDTYTSPYDTIRTVLCGCIRRALCYPYLRNWDLVSRVVVEDVVRVWRSGRRMVIRCLLGVRSVLEKSEGYYLLNRVWIDHLIGWLRVVEEGVVEKFAEKVEVCVGSSGRVLEKGEMGFGLVEIEERAFGSDSEEEEEESDDVDSSSSDENDDSSSDGDDDSSSDDEGSSSSESQAKLSATLSSSKDNTRCSNKPLLIEVIE